ncbi:hypothetical protein [Moorena sp. SIOASIH]|uniref:hypothetical protein n=1 Tax=Moorena sp. SIOASIH TaxID=2607817 RepID=UPI0026005BC0|nr:hypothetical protein [Moorena sp. SIOASIH]
MKVNLQPSTFNLQPSTFNLQPSTFNPPSTDPTGTPRANSPQPNLIIIACTS